MTALADLPDTFWPWNDRWHMHANAVAVFSHVLRDERDEARQYRDRITPADREWLLAKVAILAAIVGEETTLAEANAPSQTAADIEREILDSMGGVS